MIYHAFRRSVIADTATIQRLVLEGVCPFCGAGPYHVVATHVQKTHGIGRKELRDLAGLTYNTVLTSDAYHADKSAWAKERHDRGEGLQPEDSARGHKAKRHLSAAAQDMNREKLTRALEALRAAGGPFGDQNFGRVGGAAAAAAVRERLQPEYELAVATYDDVRQTMSSYGALQETARRLGWSPDVVTTRLNAARVLGMHTREHLPTEETRSCMECGKAFTARRSHVWGQRFCSQSCGAAHSMRPRKKGPRVGRCVICDNDFSYVRPGTAERTLCDTPACRSELMRRGREGRVASPETRAKISAARRARKTST